MLKAEGTSVAGEGVASQVKSKISQVTGACVGQAVVRGGAGDHGGS